MRIRTPQSLLVNRIHQPVHREGISGTGNAFCEIGMTPHGVSRDIESDLKLTDEKGQTFEL